MKADNNSVPLLAWLLGFAGVTIFGATLPVTKLALDDFSPWFLTFARAAIAGMAALVFLLVTARKFSHRKNPAIFLAGLLLIFGFPGFMALGLQTVPSSHGGVILGLLPLATAVMASLIAGEKQSTLFWAIGFIGTLTVIAYAVFTGERGNAGFGKGDFWLFAAGFCAALGYVISGKVSRKMPGWEMICRALALNFPLVIVGTWYLYIPEYSQASATGIIALAYLGFGSMFLGFFAWNTALAIGGIGRIGQIQLLQTFITLFFAWALLNEQIDLLTFATAATVMMLVWLSRNV